MTLAITLIIIGFICIAAVGIGATIIQNNDQKSIDDSLEYRVNNRNVKYSIPKKYQFGNYSYWVDNDGHHNYSHIWGIDGGIVMNEQSMRSKDSIFKELNDLYYKAIGHTPQWLRDERKESTTLNDLGPISLNRSIIEWKTVNCYLKEWTTPIKQQSMTLIEQLREGKIAIQNKGCTLGELKQVLKVAFPNDLWPATGESAYYFKNPFSMTSFTVANSTDLPKIPLKDFIYELDNQKPIMKKRIKYTEAQEIIDLACASAWQPKLAKLWGVDIAMKKDIEVSEELYQEGRKAANDKQNELLDRIFGKDGQYKVGDYVVPTEEHGKHRMHNRKTDRAYILLNFLSYDNVQLANEHGKDDDSGKMAIIHIRPATPEEIKKAQYLPKGTPCFVRTHKDYSWKLAYADGNGNFYVMSNRSGTTVDYPYVHKYSDGLPEE